ncbi:MAG TPA: phosphotransferase [Streptosporangiaceae bacterium]
MASGGGPVSPADQRFARQRERLAAEADVLAGRELEWSQLFGGLAHVTYAVTAGAVTTGAVTTGGADRYVVKFLTQEMDDFGLMIPIGDLIANTAAAGESGVGARVLQALPEIPALILEYIDGRTLDTPDLSRPDYIPRIGRAVRDLHTKAPPMRNLTMIWKLLDDYLALVDRHALACPPDLLGRLPTVRRIQAALAVNALPAVPSNNDLLAKNIMDDGRIRLIDYDFSGMNDPMFDVGDLAMEGDYDPDQIRVLCQAYFGAHDPVQYARARLYGIGAQYTWTLLFIGMDKLLSDSPADEFDYWQEAMSRWDWTRPKLEDPSLEALIAAAAAPPGPG